MTVLRASSGAEPGCGTWMRDCLLLFDRKGERQRLDLSDCHVNEKMCTYGMIEVLVLCGVRLLHTSNSLCLTLIVTLDQYRWSPAPINSSLFTSVVSKQHSCHLMKRASK